MTWSDRISFHRPSSPVRMGGLRCSLVACRRQGVIGLPNFRMSVSALLVLWSWSVTPPPASAQVAGEIRGTVFDTIANAGIARARIELVGNAGHVVGGPDGRFVLRGVEPGERELRITALGYLPTHLRLTVRNGATQVVRVVLTPAPITVDELVVRGGQLNALTGVQLIDREAIVASRARDLGELLQGEAGVLVVRSGGIGAPATLSIRGSSADQVLVLLDGTPINDPMTGTADLSLVPLAAVERIAVIRGVASARYGAGALAGVVAIESRQASRAEMTGQVEGGSFGEAGLSGQLGGGHQGDTWRMHGLLVAEARRSDGDFSYTIPAVRGGGEATRVNAQANMASAFATGAVGAGSTEVGVRLEWLNVDRGMPGPTTQPTPSASQAQDRLGGLATVQSGVGRWVIEADASIRRQETSYRDSAPPVRPPYHDSVAVREGTLRLQATGPVTAIATSVGADFRHQAFRSTSLSGNAPSTADYAGVWGMLRHEASVGDHDRVEVFAALRADGTSQLDDMFFSPRVGVSWHGSLVGAHFSWGGAFSPPSLADQFFQEGVLVEPNPDLGPERITNEIMAGLSLDAVSAGAIDVAADLAVFRSDIDGMILWLPDFRFVWSPHNFDVRRRGMDVALRLTHRRSAGVVRGSYSLVAVEYAGPVLTGQVAYRPKHMATVGFGFPYRWLRTEIEARYVGERRTVPGSELNSLPAYWIVDLGVSASFRLGSWSNEAFFRIENLTDQRAELLADFPLPSRAFRLGWRVTR